MLFYSVGTGVRAPQIRFSQSPKVLRSSDTLGGILAIVQLPHRVHFGFHGCWVDNASIVDT